MGTQNNSLTLFKTEFTKRLQHATKKRESLASHQVIKPFRRLDSLARLLEGDGTCASVYFDKKSRQIFIANNKIHCTSHKDNNSIRNLKAIFSLVTDETLSIEEIVEKLSEAIWLNFDWQATYKLSNSQKKDMQDQILRLLKGAFESGLKTKAWKKNVVLEENNKSSKLIEKTAKFLRDFLKLRDFLLYDYRHTTLAKDIYDAIHHNRYTILHTEENKVHAEMRILSQLLNEPDREAQYAGLSRLCCSHCGLAMAAFNLPKRGVHGQAYNWPLPRFIRENESHLKTYMGKKSYKEYIKLNPEKKAEALTFLSSKESCNRNENAKQGREMRADSSSSDVEFGVTLTDSDDNEELQSWPLADVWEMRHIRHAYEEEYRDLREIGVSMDMLVNLYKNNFNKFQALVNFDIINLANAIEIENDSFGYDASDAFDKLAEIYDDDRDLFNSIMADDINEHPLIEYGVDEFIDRYYAKKRPYSGSSNDESDCYVPSDDDDDSNDLYAKIKDELSDENNGFEYTYHSDDSENAWRYSDDDSESACQYSDDDSERAWRCSDDDSSSVSSISSNHN